MALAPCARGRCRPATDRDAMARTQALFQAALRSHRWWLAARDPEGTRPRLDPAPVGERQRQLARLGRGARPRADARRRRTIRRKDTGHVDAAMRPRDEDYQRFIHLVDTYRDCGWDPQRQWAAAPFKIADVQMTAILARSTADLHASRREPRQRRTKRASSSRMHDGLARGPVAPLAAGALPLRLPRPHFGRGHRDADAGRLHPARRRSTLDDGARDPPSPRRSSAGCDGLVARPALDGRRSRRLSSPSATGAARSGPSSTGSSRTACA